MDDKMMELAERCEQATGPDHELDVDIGRAVNAQPVMICDTGNVPIYQSFTASLDAALTLIPEGLSFVVGINVSGEHFASVDFDHQRFAATPALALCAAALKARAQERNG